MVAIVVTLMFTLIGFMPRSLFHSTTVYVIIFKEDRSSGAVNSISR